MKTILALLILAVACQAQSRHVLWYNCEPMPQVITFAVYDCAGNFVSVSSQSPTLPCRGYDVCTVPAGVYGRLEMKAWRWDAGLGRYVVVASETESLGCP